MNNKFNYQLVKFEINSVLGSIGEIEGFCKLIIDGKCKFYHNFDQVKGAMGGQTIVRNYAIVKGGSKTYMINNSFGGGMVQGMQNKTTLEEYFNDCENLVKKLKNKEFKKDKYFEAVEYYNADCTE